MNSIRAVGADKATAVANLAAALTAMVAGTPNKDDPSKFDVAPQPAYKDVATEALTAAQSVVGMLADDTSMDVQIDVFVGFSMDGDKVVHANVSANAELKLR